MVIAKQINANTTFGASEENMQTFCKQMLKTQVFHGTFKEKRYVNQIRAYRDVVCVNSIDTGLKNDLDAVRERVLRFYKDNIWMGYTEDCPQGAMSIPTIWTELQEFDVPFGAYWFEVKNILFRPNEVQIKLKLLRKFDANEGATSDDNFSTESPSFDDYLKYLNKLKNDLNGITFQFLSDNVTAENIFYFMKYMTILMGTLLMGSGYFLKFLAIYFLRFMEISVEFVRVATPISMKIIDLFGKVIGGFFILISMIWRDIIGMGRQQPQRVQQVPAINYYRNNGYQQRGRAIY